MATDGGSTRTHPVGPTVVTAGVVVMGCRYRSAARRDGWSVLVAVVGPC